MNFGFTIWAKIRHSVHLFYWTDTAVSLKFASLQAPSGHPSIEQWKKQSLASGEARMIHTPHFVKIGC